MPINTPSSSQILDDIKGYVATNPLLNIFLLLASLISFGFIMQGVQEIKTGSCLKFALLVIKPDELSIASTLFK